MFSNRCACAPHSLHARHCHTYHIHHAVLTAARRRAHSGDVWVVVVHTEVVDHQEKWRADAKVREHGTVIVLSRPAVQGREAMGGKGVGRIG
eukprot:366520-Chlamydomonas_euryale.AAC.14